MWSRLSSKNKGGGRGARAPLLDPPLQLLLLLSFKARLEKVTLWLAVYKRVLGYFHAIPDSFCAGTKTIAHRASDHTQTRFRF